MFKARVDELAESLLRTDLDAIAADDAHVVFTVRVSRRFLRENHGFLGAISDFASGADLPARPIPVLGSDPPTSAVARPTRPWWRRPIGIGAVVVLAFVVGLAFPQVHFVSAGRAFAHEIKLNFTDRPKDSPLPSPHNTDVSSQSRQHPAD